MRKNVACLLLASLLLVGCNYITIPGNGSSESSNSSGGMGTSNNSTTNNEDKLAETEENYVIYDNKMIMDSIGGSKEVPDPFIYRFNGWYYLYPTTNGGRQKAYKSQDLYFWEPVSNGVLQDGLVYDYSDDPNAPSSQTPFAPEVIYYNGMFYMVSSPSGNGHYIFESDSPEGPFYAITDNVGRSIDGSFFIDSDEKIYMFGASGGGIIAYGLEDDFKTFRKNDNGTDMQVPITNCRVGGWNEGPYLLQRNGDYYMTYCGSHYLSSSYRVDYAYAKEGSNLFSNSSYTREDTLVVATEDDFKGLGHSATVLSPDMDSYIIVYHNLNNDTTRNLCLSRLSFNGSMMVANSVTKEGAVGVDLPPFMADDDSGFEQEGDFLLSDISSEDTFTAEFNVVGEGKMIFSYQDESNYSYIEYKDDVIDICTVTDNGTSTDHTIELINDYDPDVYHTFRIQHRNGMMNLYFDNIEKAHSIDVSYAGGKIGYLASNNYSEIGYTAFSNVALGSSDNEYYADTVSLANGFDEELSYFKNGYEYLEPKKANAVQAGNKSIILKTEGDRATYRMYAREDNTYSINLRIPSAYLGQTYGLRVDDGEIIETTLTSENLKYENGDVYLSLAEVDIDQGPHNISIYNVGDEIAFSKVCYELAAFDSGFELDFTSSPNLGDFHKYNTNGNISSEGLDSNYLDLQALVSDYEYSNYTIEATFKLDDLYNSGLVGLIFNVSDFSKNYSQDGDGSGNPDMFRGYRLAIESGKVILEYVDFNYGHTLKTKSFDYGRGETYTLTAEVYGNNITCYLDAEELFTVSGNLGNINGKVGVIAKDCDATFKSLMVV